LLKVKNLAAYYETIGGAVKAVDGVSFTVNRGEIFGIAGESGSGKSTLARAILRLLEPPAEIKHGEVIFEDTDLASMDEDALRGLRGSQLTYIPQSSMNALNPVMNIGSQFADVIAYVQTPIPNSDVNSRLEGFFYKITVLPTDKEFKTM
ncbi:MAG: ATP-binding cassette domain-containing protein, partial [Candidatus Marinimicrobia bacterium]|nr:ATP-binding cassette domain-containing protein [Candidatus Neomarinimicrobiota bacterium]